MGTNISYAETAEGFQVEPALTVNERYDDNINLSSGLETHDFITAVIPRVTLSYKGLMAESSLSYAAAAEFFRGHSDHNTVKHLADLNSRYRLSQTLDLTLQDQFVYSPEATDITPTGIVTPRNKQYLNNGSAGVSQQLSPLTNVGIEYSYMVHRYENPSLVDSTVQGVNLMMTHQFTPTDTGKTHAGVRYFTFDDAIQKKIYTISLGETHHFSETLDLDANGGANLYQDPNNANHYIPSALFDVSLRKSWKAASAELRYLRDLSDSGGLARSYLTYQSVALDIQMTLSRNLRATLTGIYATHQSVTGTSINAVLYTGMAGLDYDITAWLKGNIGYSYIQQNSHGSVGHEIRRNQAFVGLTATLPK
jgi:opacity protein-like surface antigen